MTSILPFAPASRAFSKFRKAIPKNPAIIAFGPASIAAKLAKSIRDDGSGLDGDLASKATWYDFGHDRHQIAVIPLDRRDAAIALVPAWRVLIGPEFYLFQRVDIGGSEQGRKAADVRARSRALLAAGKEQEALDVNEGATDDERHPEIQVTQGVRARRRHPEWQGPLPRQARHPGEPDEVSGHDMR